MIPTLYEGVVEMILCSQNNYYHFLEEFVTQAEHNRQYLLSFAYHLWKEGSLNVLTELKSSMACLHYFQADSNTVSPFDEKFKRPLLLLALIYQVVQVYGCIGLSGKNVCMTEPKVCKSRYC